MVDLDHHPAAVDIGHLEAHRLRGPQASRIGRRQRGARLQRRHCLEEAYDFILRIAGSLRGVRA